MRGDSSRITPRRIGVCGSSKNLPVAAIPFCRAVGAALAKRPFIVVVSGGTRHRKSMPAHDLAADWYMVDAARDAILAATGADETAVGQRIETVLSAGTKSSDSFHIGTVVFPRGESSASRRFSFVRNVDALIAVGGGGGTAQELTLAHELEKPVLPVPFYGGTARDFWEEHRPELAAALRLTRRQVGGWSVKRVPSARRAAALAREMVRALLQSLPLRCFVIMPFSPDFKGHFDFVIRPAVEAAGDEAIQLQRAGIPGDVNRQIHDSIASCDYAVAVLDGMRPNVLYELGRAHGQGKSTILMRRQGEAEPIPFDIAPQQRIEYEALDESLPGRVLRAIQRLPGRRSAAAARGGRRRSRR